MVDQPGFRITASPAEIDSVNGPEEHTERAQRFVESYRSRCPPEAQPPACRLRIHEAAPPHAGLGSGTQLGLAVAQSLALLAGEGHVDSVELAQRVGRGLRSALGIHGFARGGFLVDGGKRSDESPAPLVARADFPAEWRMVLVTPETPGLSGAEERNAFAALPPMPQALTGELCRVALLELLPAVLEAEFDTCGDALHEFGRQVGGYFAPVQGGVYADPSMRELATHLRRGGIRGVGQSSWGPTTFVLCRHHSEAVGVIRDLTRDARWAACGFRAAAPMNTGAVLEFADHA